MAHDIFKGHLCATFTLRKDTLGKNVASTLLNDGHEQAFEFTLVKILDILHVRVHLRRVSLSSVLHTRCGHSRHHHHVVHHHWVHHLVLVIVLIIAHLLLVAAIIWVFIIVSAAPALLIRIIITSSILIVVVLVIIILVSTASSVLIAAATAAASRVRVASTARIWSLTVVVFLILLLVVGLTVGFLAFLSIGAILRHLLLGRVGRVARVRGRALRLVVRFLIIRSLTGGWSVLLRLRSAGVRSRLISRLVRIFRWHSKVLRSK